MPMIEMETRSEMPKINEELGRVTRVEIGARDKPIWVISKKGKYPSAETWNEI
jgi:hypothetical protein